MVLDEIQPTAMRAALAFRENRITTGRANRRVFSFAEGAVQQDDVQEVDHEIEYSVWPGIQAGEHVLNAETQAYEGR